MHLDPATRLAPRERFTDLGMDLLMALQLQSDLADSLGLGDQLPATLAFDTGTVEELTDQLLRLIAPSNQVDEPDPAASLGPVRGRLTAADLEAFSEAEVEALLAQRVLANQSVVQR